MASLYTRGKNKIFWVKWKENGEPRYESLFPLRKGNRLDEKAAELVRTEKELEEKKGLSVYRKRLLPLVIADHVNNFLAIKKRIVKTKTYEAYDTALDHYLKFFGPLTRLKDITPEKLDDYKAFLLLKKSYNTTVSYNNRLKTFYDYLKAERYIKINSLRRMKYREMPITVIPDKELKIIYAYFEDKDILKFRFVKMLRLFGLRTGEACNLHWEHFDLINRVLNIRNEKAGRIDTIPISKEAYKFLTGWRKNFGKIFPWKGNDSLKWWNRGLASKELNMPGRYCLHDLRRTFGTEMAKKLTTKELQRVMRHEDIRTTMKYYIFVDMKKIGAKM